eukprot:scaffold1308_cov247-Pinguiococcus_pyrenoidosus.AAC.3
MLQLTGEVLRCLAFNALAGPLPAALPALALLRLSFRSPVSRRWTFRLVADLLIRGVVTSCDTQGDHGPPMIWAS